MEITEDNFDEVFKPQINHLERAKQPKSVADRDVCCFNGCAYETYGEDLEYVRKVNDENPKRIWTIIEVDGIMYFSTGYHHVNRYMYLICEVEFTEEMDVELEGSDSDDEWEEILKEDE